MHITCAGQHGRDRLSALHYCFGFLLVSLTPYSNSKIIYWPQSNHSCCNHSLTARKEGSHTQQFFSGTFVWHLFVFIFILNLTKLTWKNIKLWCWANSVFLFTVPVSTFIARLISLVLKANNCASMYCLKCNALTQQFSSCSIYIKLHIQQRSCICISACVAW